VSVRTGRRGKAAVSLSSSGVGGRSAVPLEHSAGLPIRDAHEVTFRAALGEPLVGEGVAELVRMEAWEADLGAAAAQHHAQARVSQPAVLAQPKPRHVSVLVAAASP
jgi:hypothetical protein